jgi:very-short-patch-repair endonuclease
MVNRNQNRLIKQATRNLRKSQTTAEQTFWEIIRNRKILGKKFLRQYPIIYKWRGKQKFFVADFYCHENRLIIELDGGIHA